MTTKKAADYYPNAPVLKTIATALRKLPNKPFTHVLVDVDCGEIFFTSDDGKYVTVWGLLLSVERQTPSRRRPKRKSTS